MYISFKKLYYILFVFVCFLCALTFFCKNYEKFIVNDLSKAVIRFHVRANSNSTKDQELKMKIKEKIIEFLETGLDTSANTEDARDFLKRNTANIENLAADTVKNLGYNYPVKATLGTSSFPDRSYGDVKFPSGTYESFIVEIGSGVGDNWWCVLYPPLCFVDASTGHLPDDSKKLLSESLTTSEYEYITDNSSCNIQFRFKYFTFLNNLF